MHGPCRPPAEKPDRAGAKRRCLDQASGAKLEVHEPAPQRQRRGGDGPPLETAMCIEIEQIIDSLTVTVDTGYCRTQVAPHADGTYSLEVSDLDEAGGLRRSLAVRGPSQGDLLGLLAAAAVAVARVPTPADVPAAACPLPNGKG
jgi:hypothetical protein